MSARAYSTEQIKQIIHMLDNGHSRKEIIGATNVSSTQYERVLFCYHHGMADKLISGEYSAYTLKKIIESGSGVEHPEDNAIDDIKAEPSLDELVLNGIIGVSLARKLAEADHDMRKSFIEDISRFMSHIYNPEASFHVRIDNELLGKALQIKEKEEQIRHLDREIASRRAASVFVRQLRDTLNVLRDMELGLERGDLTGIGLIERKEIGYHSATLRRLADAMDNARETEERLVCLDVKSN